MYSSSSSPKQRSKEDAASYRRWNSQFILKYNLLSSILGAEYYSPNQLFQKMEMCDDISQKIKKKSIHIKKEYKNIT